MKKGFVLVEFVIALPMLILLIYALGNMTYKIFNLAKNQAADYVLEVEAQEILSQITNDARAAYSVKIKHQEIFFNYHAIANNQSADYFKNNFNSKIEDLVDLIYTSRYVVRATETHDKYIYRERKEDGPVVNPISGGNFFGDTIVSELTFKRDKKILHITLELQSVVTKHKLKINTAVFMPACED